LTGPSDTEEDIPFPTTAGAEEECATANPTMINIIFGSDGDERVNDKAIACADPLWMNPEWQPSNKQALFPEPLADEGAEIDAEVGALMNAAYQSARSENRGVLKTQRVSPRF
jgi:hypothetical protein